MNDQENWRPVPGYEGYYSVSDLGRVRCEERTKAMGRKRRGHLLTPASSGHGHLQVQLHREGIGRHFRVHRLVLSAFIGPCPNGLIACHNDGNPKNNILSNLRWDTHSSNVLDAVRHGTHKGGHAGAGMKLCKDQVLEILSATGLQKDIASRFGVSTSVVCNIKLGLSWGSVTGLKPYQRYSGFKSEAPTP